WRPLFLRFAKGGKMVATCGGVFFGVAVWVALTALLAWLVTVALFRYVSVASIVAGISLPVMAAVYGYPTSVVVFGAGAAAAILYLHRGNLRRLRAGTEHRFRLRRPASA
ncbi:MAG TPA: glycerol-3-phosphate acyltransferase, partial [Gaiellaceae bacterium]|nr:glycerol-3-phosphate acyltransferase [Gaiellaceae bacterium]